MNIAQDVQMMREMAEQGVTSSLDLKGPLGDKIRADRKPVIEELVRQGRVNPSVLAKF